MSFIAAGVAGGVGLLKAGVGLIQNNQANSIDKANPFPVMSVQNEYKQNLNQAENMAQVGTPQQQYNNQQNNIQTNQASGIAALSRSANPGANLASVVRAGNDATGQLNARDAMDRNRNLLNLLRERQVLAQQKDKAWDWNYQQKYLGNLAKANQIRGAGNANISGALGDVSGAATAVLGNGGFEGDGFGGESSPVKTSSWGQSVQPTGAFSYGAQDPNYTISQWGYQPPLQIPEIGKLPKKIY